MSSYSVSISEMPSHDSSRCPECNELGQFRERRTKLEVRVWECDDCGVLWHRGSA